MPVVIEEVAVVDLETQIKAAKDAGRRILALSPSKFKKIGRIATNFEVISYTLVTQ